jgi:hypothetical protein
MNQQTNGGISMRCVALFVALLALIPVVGMNAQTTADDPLAGKPPFKRLFLDAMVTEESSGLSRVFHAAEKYPGNPIIVKDKPWEGWGPYLYGTIIRDEGKLKTWYQCIGGDDGGFVCYAESVDGIKWTKPNLGIIDFNGSTANNIVEMNEDFHIPSVMKLTDAGVSDGKWVMYGFSRRVGPHMAFSPDGLRWNGRTNDERLFASSDVTHYFYDPYESNSRFTSDPTGQSPDGRYVVRFDGAFSQEVGMGRANVEIALIQIA